MEEPRERVCVNGLSPDSLVRVPTEAEFEGRDFMRSKELRQIAEAIIRTERFGLTAIAFYEAQVEYLWVNKSKKRQGRPVLGACTKETGRTKFYSDRDYTVMIYAGTLRDVRFTQWQLQALIDHELRHIAIEVDEETGAVTFGIVGHDAELFHRELEFYGLWRQDLEQTAEAFQQAPLFGMSTAIEEARRLSESGVTVIAGGRKAKTPEEIDQVVGGVVSRAFDVANRASGVRASNVTPDQAEALQRAGAANHAG